MPEKKVMMNKLNFFNIFKQRLNEDETVVTQETDMDKILRQSGKVANVLTQLLTSQKKVSDKSLEEIRSIVADIKVIAVKPTTFRIILQNFNSFDLIYNPSPAEKRYPEDFSPIDSFIVKAGGKKYYIVNNSEFEQAIDAINKLMRENPIGNPEPTEEEPTEEPSDEKKPEEEPEEKPEK